jgi:hypothetical protein
MTGISIIDSTEDWLTVWQRSVEEGFHVGGGSPQDVTHKDRGEQKGLFLRDGRE